MAVYSVKNAEIGVSKFTKSEDAKLTVIEGGQHFLSASRPEEVNELARSFIKKWS
jgi:hypothetical protein